jgi:hypothetical protein
MNADGIAGRQIRCEDKPEETAHEFIMVAT